MSPMQCFDVSHGSRNAPSSLWDRVLPHNSANAYVRKILFLSRNKTLIVSMSQCRNSASDFLD